jgi:predicted phosphodiesterase
LQRDKRQVKIAVLSDIHGNIDALDAVLADMAARNVELCVNLGDILSGPLFPCETADRLMAMDLPTIRGNHERQLLTLAPDRMGASDRATHDLLAPRHRDWIAALPETLWLTDEILMVHGTPDSDIEYWLETVEPNGLHAATEAEVEARAVDPVRPYPCAAHPSSRRWRADRQSRQRRPAGL